jgi:hypothetical protein
VTSPDVEIPRAAYGVAFPLAVVAGYVDASDSSRSPACSSPT